MTAHSDRKSAILILDFGSQYSQLLARRVRELGVYCELWHWDVTSSQIREFNPRGIILSGSPESATKFGSRRAPDGVFTLGVPVLGICYGMQIMALQLGGEVENAKKREFGPAKVRVTAISPFLEHLGQKYHEEESSFLDVWMSHGDNVTKLPPNFIAIAETENCPYAIIADEKNHFYGIQFHPEVTQTLQGDLLLSRFVINICGCDPKWTPTNIIEERVVSLRQKLGNDKVILALSGGVDSSVAALLLHRAIGDRLTCVFVDNGLLRLNEATEVMEMFHEHFQLNVIPINARDRFFEALRGVVDPEEKRKTIGRVFIDVFDDVATNLPEIKWLAQGTIYSDVIESAATKTGGAQVIKSHHNVGGLPEKLSLKLVEPLNDLFKDEVRKIGLALGLPQTLLWRHPFPGPGLGVRVLGEIKNTFCDLLRHADAIFIEELHKQGLYSKVSQAFAVFLPLRSVGVMGDERQYDWIIALRAVETTDFMTARWAQLPYDFLAQVSNRIINEVRGISRVVYDISGKPPATIEWE